MVQRGVFLPQQKAEGAPWGQRDTRGEKHYCGVPLFFFFFLGLGGWLGRLVELPLRVVVLVGLVPSLSGFHLALPCQVAHFAAVVAAVVGAC